MRSDEASGQQFRDRAAGTGLLVSSGSSTGVEGKGKGGVSATIR